MQTADPLVEGRRLTKRFGSFVAVDAVDFRVERGQSFGFLGPNGAGKTSTMRMIACVSTPSDGELRVFGLDPAAGGREIRSRLGVVPQEDTLDLELTVLDNMIIYGRYFGLPRRVCRERAERLLEFVQLDGRRAARVEELSGGMKRRLTVARALISEPELLLLDEPTTGLDPQARHLVWDRLYQLKRRGVSLVLTTHYMDEAEQLCDRVVIMDRGRFAAEGSPRDLIATHSTRDVVELRFEDDTARASALAELTAAESRIEPLADRVLVYADDGEASAEWLARRDIHPDSLLVRRSTLEDVFLAVTGRQLIEDVIP